MRVSDIRGLSNTAPPPDIAESVIIALAAGRVRTTPLLIRAMVCSPQRKTRQALAWAGPAWFECIIQCLKVQVS